MLTDKEIRAAMPAAKPYKPPEGRGGPVLAVLPTGRKAWRLRLFRDGKETMLARGDYPKVSLSAARDKAHTRKSATREGRIVAAERKGIKPAAGNRVRDIAAVWIEGKSGWTAAHRNRVSGQLDRLVFPTLGDRPVAAVTAAEALATLRSISSADLAARCRTRLAAIFGTAVVLGRTAANPVRSLNGMPRRRNHATSGRSRSASTFATRSLRYTATAGTRRCASGCSSASTPRCVRAWSALLSSIGSTATRSVSREA